MPEIVPVKQKVDSLAKVLTGEDFIRQLKLAMPRGGLTAERMARIVLTEVRRTPKLADCSPQSFFGAVMTCAQLGLEPGPLGFAYMIPYGNECQFQVGYKGMLQLVWRSDKIASVSAGVFYTNDSFDYDEGAEPYFKFRRRLDGDRGQRIGVFAAIKTKTGGLVMRVMSASDVEDHFKKFVKAKSGPWYDDGQTLDEMWVKTVLKKAAKWAPISADAQMAISLDDRAELGVHQEIDVSPPPPSKKAIAETAPEYDPNTGEELPPASA